jgi:hypothetical protein
MTVFSFLIILQALCLAQAEGMGQISKQAGFWGTGSKYADKWHNLEFIYWAGAARLASSAYKATNQLGDMR